MSTLEALAVIAAGLGAGLINAVAGSGTLLTFPVLLAVGVPPVTANTSNAIGLTPGGVAAAWGTRGALAGHGGRVVALVGFTVVGAVIGSLLLLALPASVFALVVPVLILVSVVLVALQRRIGHWVQARRQARGTHRPGPLERLGVLGVGAYGGYFGAAQGILLVALLGTTLPDDLHAANAIKNVLGTAANAVATVVFVAVAPVDWSVVALIAAGSIVGGLAGGRIGRHLSPSMLRGVLVVVGLAAVARELL